MRARRLVLRATAVLGAAATRDDQPGGDSLPSCPRPLGVDPQTASALAGAYAALIGNYTAALAQSFLADGFTGTSDSINALAGLPLGSVTFSSKQAFMASQAGQPRIPLVVTAASAVGCDTLVLRWTQTFGADDLPVAGISVLSFACEGAGARRWRLRALETEFNSLLYYRDMGGSCSLS